MIGSSDDSPVPLRMDWGDSEEAGGAGARGQDGVFYSAAGAGRGFGREVAPMDWGEREEGSNKAAAYDDGRRWRSDVHGAPLDSVPGAVDWREREQKKQDGFVLKQQRNLGFKEWGDAEYVERGSREQMEPNGKGAKKASRKKKKKKKASRGGGVGTEAASEEDAGGDGRTRGATRGQQLPC